MIGRTSPLQPDFITKMKEVSHICHHLVIMCRYLVLHGMPKSIKEEEMKSFIITVLSGIAAYPAVTLGRICSNGNDDLLVRK